ncbi:hypothetical protein BDN72DRAFT_824214 [Pluteus cervinus]|uniref:Uncharacterized protein n=1 Tax=Pluteus cervinus TaxID=181527 RepID=A0ACD3AJR8_9AGAR|nr:hypothetical protein BDN72DRAFT_824214 [Pluteus cervinus]
MITILLTAALSSLRAGAVPISAGPATLPSTVHTIVFGVHARADCGTDLRSTYEIIRSCLVTIAACVYRAIHQNIPDPSLSFWGRLRVTMKVTCYALIAPEMMIWWAMRQWFGARSVARELKWTHTHGQFAQMGGFGRKDDKRVLYPYTLIRLLENRQLDLDELRLTEKEIQDKSKGDILSKGLVAFQTTWFVFECLARLHQGLPLIELEVVTLAFAMLNIITYGLWWYKPLNVLCPIYICVNEPPPPTESNLESLSLVASAPNLQGKPVLGGDSEGVLANEVEELRVGKYSGKKVTVGANGMVGVPVRTEVPDVVGSCPDPWYSTAWKLLIVQPFMAVEMPLKELFDDQDVHEEATHVSTFYARIIEEDEENWLQALCSSVGMIFGAIHFLSWSSAFPSHGQLLLWRISSIFLVFLSVLVLFRPVFNRMWLKATYGSRWERRAGTLRNFFENLLFFAGPIPYMLARFCILGLALFTLHDPPLDAFIAVSWTSYIPHL